MPGLAALLMPKYDKKIAKSIIEISGTMQHEKFYRTNLFDNGVLPIVASRVHLNIINKSRQPIFNEDKTIFIMMDGELHSREGLKERLLLSGHDVRTDSDAELLLHLYEDLGDKFVNDLNGWFVVLIHDMTRGKTLVVNDCFGIYPTYYAEEDGNLIIASEIKCLLKYKAISYSVNDKSVAELFTYNAVRDERTMFNEIYRLPPASVWTYINGRIDRKQYNKLSGLGENTKMTEREFCEEGNKIFERIIPRYLSGEGVGISLTGGWDTRAIISLTNEYRNFVPCYTFGGPYRDALDVVIARKVADICGQEHKVFRIGNEFLYNFASYALNTVYISDGTADIFTSHELYLNGLVRSWAPIRVTGKYGSQVLGGLVSLKRRKLDPRIFSDQFLAEIRSLDDPVARVRDMSVVLNEIRWFWLGYLPLETSQVVVRTPYTDRDILEFLLDAPTDLLTGSKLQKFIIKQNNPRLALIPSDKGVYIGRENLLMRSNHFLLYFLNNFDGAYNWHGLPHSLSRLDTLLIRTNLQKLFLGHHKFTNYRLWLKNELRDFARKILLDDLTLSRKYFNPEFIKKLTFDHFNKGFNYTNEIGKIVSFELWHRLFVD